MSALKKTKKTASTQRERKNSIWRKKYSSKKSVWICLINRTGAGSQELARSTFKRITLHPGRLSSTMASQCTRIGNTSLQLRPLRNRREYTKMTRSYTTTLASHTLRWATISILWNTWRSASSSTTSTRMHTTTWHSFITYIWYTRRPWTSVNKLKSLTDRVTTLICTGHLRSLKKEMS